MPARSPADQTSTRPMRGPLTGAQVRQIKKRVPQDKKCSVRCIPRCYAPFRRRFVLCKAVDAPPVCPSCWTPDRRYTEQRRKIIEPLKLNFD